MVSRVFFATRRGDDVVLILMGVTGAGKTTVGELLAQRLGWHFADADEFHSPGNIQKMTQGIPLDDSDRVPWLQVMRGAITRWNDSGENVVLGCSALKRSYRDQLRGPAVQFVYLKGSRDLILQRLDQRHGHFATASILDGQFRDLEEPKHALAVNVENAPEDIASEIIEKLNLAAGSRS